jgi:hypothetical protein
MYGDCAPPGVRERKARANNFAVSRSPRSSSIRNALPKRTCNEPSGTPNVIADVAIDLRPA